MNRIKSRGDSMAGHTQRLKALRDELARRGLAGFVVPLSDEHNGEYVPAHAQRLAWLTGFVGSAGMAIVLAERAAIFVDGRYVLQVQDQVDCEAFDPRHIGDDPPDAWIEKHLPRSGRLGYDPWLHTPTSLIPLRQACAVAGGELFACDSNPIDTIWSDQPAPPLAPISAHEQRFSGRSSEDKRREIAGLVRAAGADAVVLSAPDSIAWLLNVRGGDVPHAPLPLSFALLHGDGGELDWFVDGRKLSSALDAHLGRAVRVHPPADLGAALDRLGAQGKRVQVDPAGAVAWLFDRLTMAGADIIEAADPCLLPKACKNAAELAGARAAHLRDGAALCRFLAWLAVAAPDGEVTEMAAAAKLEAFRGELEEFRDLSFPTISGAGPNGAIVHYRVSAATNRRLAAGDLYLVDSGAQYADGTTDVTRTVYIGRGRPTAEQRDRFTRVLKGHIALARLRFPKGTTGTQIDALARAPLWQVGLDFDHGTGHGVGSYLSVHEGPQRIAKRGGVTPLMAGMIVSNEPGYYKAGAYGIRIENLVIVRAAEDMEVSASNDFLCFETLTLAPIERELIELSLLDGAEIGWLDAYHERLCRALTPLVDEATAQWLTQVTRPL